MSKPTPEQQHAGAGLRRVGDEIRPSDVHGFPDVRGREVVDEAGRRLGRVEGLVAEGETGRVRYVGIHAAAEGVSQDHHVLVPVAFVDADGPGDAVRLQGMAPHVLGQLPQVDEGPLTRAFEVELRRAIEVHVGAGRDGSADPHAPFYEHPHFEGLGSLGEHAQIVSPGGTRPGQPSYISGRGTEE